MFILYRVTGSVDQGDTLCLIRHGPKGWDPGISGQRNWIITEIERNHNSLLFTLKVFVTSDIDKRLQSDRN